MADTFWQRCNTCKREIGFSQAYWTCSVSTCNRRATSFVFCSVECWQSHVPTLRHRDAWAEEQRSPTLEETTAARSEPAMVSTPTPASSQATTDPVQPAQVAADVPREILIVTSKLKKYVRARSGMNTSDSVMAVLSTRVRALCDAAIVRAQEHDRKTVLDRDF